MKILLYHEQQDRDLNLEEEFKLDSSKCYCTNIAPFNIFPGKLFHYE